MTDNSPAQSMEAILASIKRIIADPPAEDRTDRDEPRPPTQLDAPAAPRARWTPEDDVLELGGAVTHDAALQPLPPPEPAALVSTATRDASARAIAALSAVAIDPAAADNTLEGLVRELLRPMLKEWLDANLPDLVERVVAREVARLGAR